MQDLKSLLQNAGFQLTSEEELQEQEALEKKHRSKTVLERPKEEVKLQAYYNEPSTPKKIQRDPTPELIEMPVGMDAAQLADWMCVNDDEHCCDRFLVMCENTSQVWFCRNQLILDMNFIYREDLKIVKIPADNAVLAPELYLENASGWNPGVNTRKFCYILDSPATEKYEVYYESNYPALKYGKATPNGMFVHRYENRFHRDMAILELDRLYSSASKADAKKMQKREFGASEAYVVSDGCWMRDSCASSYYYMDKTSLVKMTIGFLPSDAEQAVLTSEITAATQALLMCYTKKKKKVRYYYDNTSIVNCLRNKKLEYLDEIKTYKELLEKMLQEGYDVKFIELHPKTGEDRDDTNKALMFFHNYCDEECRNMTDIFRKDYRSIAGADQSDGKSYSQYKEEFKPKKPQNNSRNGNNRYGKRF